MHFLRIAEPLLPRHPLQAAASVDDQLGQTLGMLRAGLAGQGAPVEGGGAADSPWARLSAHVLPMLNSIRVGDVPDDEEGLDGEGAGAADGGGAEAGGAGQGQDSAAPGGPPAGGPAPAANAAALAPAPYQQYIIAGGAPARKHVLERVSCARPACGTSKAAPAHSTPAGWL